MRTAFSSLSDTWQAVAVLCAALILSGCIILPIPTKAEEPPYTEEQLAQIQVGFSTREKVKQSLHDPDLQAFGGKFWVYDWTIRSGKWFAAIPLMGYVGTGDSHISQTDFALFLEFDGSGLLSRKEFGKVSGSGGNKRYCTSNGICLEHRIEAQTVNRPFRQNESAITVSAGAKDSLPWPNPANDQCVVVIWPNPEDWATPHGLNVGVRELLPLSWLPVGSYVVVALPVGEQPVWFTSPRTGGSWAHSLDPNDLSCESSIQCKAGQVFYLEIAAKSRQIGHELPVILRTIDPEAGRKAVAGMARMLPP